MRRDKHLIEGGRTLYRYTFDGEADSEPEPAADSKGNLEPESQEEE